MLNTSRPGLGMDYPPPTKRDSLFSERESQLDSQYHPPGLSLYGQDPGLSGNRTSGLGRAGNPVITQVCVFSMELYIMETLCFFLFRFYLVYFHMVWELLQSWWRLN